ncbi:M3 family oligoendopeptidase [Acidaminobacter sp.]|uniref:M3 family oligoendopeptidase n=1 Tax=Acidaminobacter sp. TaxID=1872102 RepID=UPI002561F86E|nr:M3 family metallopeptidase [Acidaminobacter sp.]MDK9711664.1 M3 family metallopeptidase [Acidaminobacter sp.]
MNRDEQQSREDDPKRIENEGQALKGAEAGSDSAAGSAAEVDLSALENGECGEELAGLDDAQDLEELKIRRAKRLKRVAWILVLAVTAGALFGILSGGAFSRWFHAKTQPGAAFVAEGTEPAWDLSPVYSGLEEAEEVLSSLQGEVSLILSRETAADEASLDRIMRTAERLQVYATLMRDADMGNAEAKAFQTSVDTLVNKVTRLSQGASVSESGPSIYELSGAYERIYQSFSHSYGVEFGEDPDLFSDNADRRYKAFRRWVALQEPSAEVFADIYEGKVGFNNYLALTYGETQASEAYLAMDEFTPEAFEQLMSITEQHLALNHRWIALRAALSGLNGPMRFSDLFMDLPQGADEAEAEIGVDQASRYMQQVLSALPDAGQTIVKRAFDEAWIDFYPRADKYEGAYTYGAYESHPYLLLNFTGNSDSLEELAHELGHAVHMTLSAQSQPFDTYYADVAASEWAASVTEILYHEDRVNRAETREDKIAALANYLDFLSSTYFDQMLATEFEIESHRMAQDGEDLSGESLKDLWRSLTAKYMGPAYEITELDGYDWVSYPHLYWDFYMYKYATGIVAGAPLARGLLSGQPGAADSWMRLMTAGGSESGAALMAEAGFDFESEEIYKSFFFHWSELMDELELLMNAS